MRSLRCAFRASAHPALGVDKTANESDHSPASHHENASRFLTPVVSGNENNDSELVLDTVTLILYSRGFLLQLQLV